LVEQDNVLKQYIFFPCQMLLFIPFHFLRKIILQFSDYTSFEINY